MIFQSEPGHLVTFRKRKTLINPLPKKIRFDKNGHYETNDPRIIKLFERRFEKAHEYQCKHCDYKTYDKVELMRHYKTHKENENDQ
jgi:hypothetical protein